MIDVNEYIDWDERDFPGTAPEIELPTCESCRKPAALLTYQPDWDFHCCAECLAACERELAECEHLRVSVEEHDDVGIGYGEDNYVRRWEVITCRDCGRELRENRSGELEVA